MNIPVNPVMWIMAILPIMLLLILLLKFQWSAAEAAAVGLAAVVFAGFFFYRADVEVIAVETAKGVWSAVPILLIIWTAILLYQVGNAANAFFAIQRGMQRFLPNQILQVLAMGWIFESFLQGITGFGVPVAVGAPLLLSIGVTPFWAVVIPLLGQSWGNTFGTLGAGWDALMMSAGISGGTAAYQSAALWSAIFLWIWNVIVGMVICGLYGGKRGLKKGFAAVLVLSTIQGGGELLLGRVNTTLSCFIPACVSLGAVLLLGRTKMYQDAWSVDKSKIMRNDMQKTDFAPKNGMTLTQAFCPYLVLIAVTIMVLLLSPVYKVLNAVSIGFRFPETATGYGVVNSATEKFGAFAPLTHASAFLLLSAIVGMIYYWRKGWLASADMKTVFQKSVSMTLPSGLAVVSLVVMSKIMDGIGATAVMARGFVDVLGNGYLVLVPFVGLMGTFVTGSNMSSNILFGSFQMTTASMLGANAALLLAAQTVGGAIGSAVSPSKIILGTTTAGILGQEGAVLKKLLIITVPLTILMGVSIFLLNVLGG